MYGLMKMLDEEQLEETLSPSFSIRREWTANLYAEKSESYFYVMTNSFLTRKDSLVYNGNNSSGVNFFRKLLLFINHDKRGRKNEIAGPCECS